MKSDCQGLIEHKRSNNIGAFPLPRGSKEIDIQFTFNWVAQRVKQEEKDNIYTEVTINPKKIMATKELFYGNQYLKNS